MQTRVVQSYEVGVTYCDGTRFQHHHDEVQGATREYARMLAEACEPTLTHPDARHVAQISLYRLDRNGDLIGFVQTPVLPCEHLDND